MLELEQQLVMERKRLAQLRKQHYHMAQLAVAEQVNICAVVASSGSLRVLCRIFRVFSRRR